MKASQVFRFFLVFLLMFIVIIMYYIINIVLFSKERTSGNKNLFLKNENLNLDYTRVSNSKDFTYSAIPTNSTVKGSSSYNEGFEFANGNCNNNLNCFYPYGICVNSTTCMCMPEYANIHIRNHQEMFCSYQKKKVLIAGMLELFLPLGLGHFYAEHNTLALIKICYNFIVYFFGCILYYRGIHENSKFGSVGTCVILTCIIPLWNLFDVFMFFTYNYRDGFGVPMC